jgi:DNA-binding PadR family transcriptional regulator
MRSSPGQRLRSRLNWLILKTLALDIATPRTLAEISEVADATLHIMLRDRRRRPMPRTTQYLLRLADQGFVKLEGIKRRRRATLTPRGRRALHALEASLAARQKAGWASAGDTLQDRLARLRKRFRSAPIDRSLRLLETRVAQYARLFPGRLRETAFVSYDLPARDPRRRLRVISILRSHGFQRLHQSMYTGSAQRLRAVLEDLEMEDVLPLLRWGTLTVFSP